MYGHTHRAPIKTVKQYHWNQGVPVSDRKRDGKFFLLFCALLDIIILKHNSKSGERKRERVKAEVCNVHESEDFYSIGEKM